MDNVCSKLNNGIVKHLDEVMRLDVGSNEMSNAVADVAVLYKLRIEEEKLEVEKNRMAAEKSEQDECHAFDRKKLLIDTVVACAELTLPLALYGLLSYVGFAREFDGVVSSDTLKRVLNSIKTKK